MGDPKPSETAPAVDPAAAADAKADATEVPEQHELVVKGLEAKAQGNVEFKANAHKAAVTKYTEAIDNLEDYHDLFFDSK